MGYNVPRKILKIHFYVFYILPHKQILLCSFSILYSFSSSSVFCKVSCFQFCDVIFAHLPKLSFSHCFKKWFYCTMKTRPPKHCFARILREEFGWNQSLLAGASACSAYSQLLSSSRSGRRGQRGAQVSRIVVSLPQYFSSRTHQRENQQCQMREPSIWLLPQVKARRGLRICVVCQCGGYPSAFGAPELFCISPGPILNFTNEAAGEPPKPRCPSSPRRSAGVPRGLADRSGFHCGEVWDRLRRGRPVKSKAGS